MSRKLRQPDPTPPVLGATPITLPATFTFPIGTGSDANLMDGLPLSPKLGTSRAGISSEGSSDLIFNQAVTIAFSRLLGYAYYEFFMGVVGPSVAFVFDEAQVTISNPANTTQGQIRVQLSDQTMQAGLVAGMVFGGGVNITEQLYLPSSWKSPWKFTWHTVFQANLAFEIDFLALFLELIEYLLHTGAADGLISHDTANTVSPFIKGRESFNFSAYSTDSFGASLHDITAYPQMQLPINLADFSPILATFVKLLEKVKGDLAFGPGLFVVMPVQLGITGFTVEGGQGDNSSADYSSLHFNDGGIITATGPKAFTTKPTKFTTNVSYTSSFTLGVSCMFSISACKIFNLTLNTGTLDILTLLGIPLPSLPTVASSVSTSVGNTCVLEPTMSLLVTPAQTDPSDPTLLLPGVAALVEVLLSSNWTGPDTQISLTINPSVSGFPSQVMMLHNSMSAEFLLTLYNQCVYTGDPDNPGAKGSPTPTSPYQSFSITAKLPPDASQPCKDFEVTTSVKLKNTVIIPKLASGTPGDAPVWNPGVGGGQLNANSAFAPSMANNIEISFYFPQPLPNPPASIPVVMTLYNEQRMLHVGSNVRVTLSSGGSAVLNPSATFTIPPPTLVGQGLRSNGYLRARRLTIPVVTT